MPGRLSNTTEFVAAITADDLVAICDKDTCIWVKAREILYFFAHDHYVYAYIDHKKKRIVTRRPLSEWIKLVPRFFMRAGKQYLVNPIHVADYNRKEHVVR